MAKQLDIISPSDGSIVATRTLASCAEVAQVLQNCQAAQQTWRASSVQARAAYCTKAVDWLLAHRHELGVEISQQMGRPIQYAASEIDAVRERAQYMIEVAEQALKDIPLAAKPGFRRFIRPTPLGTVLVIAPWNYPYLTAVNAIIPALMAGNCVLLKHSAQTLLCSERFAQAFAAAKLPAGVFQYVHVDHEQTAKLVQEPAINYISFTGSVAGGRAMEKSAAGLFKSLALELGGKDAAYVRHDAQLDTAVASLVEGAFFNSGQSCCGIERIYVHEAVYPEFLTKFVALTKKQVLGDASQADTSLGPMVNAQACRLAHEQVAAARQLGAVLHICAEDFPLPEGDCYFAPQVLTQVNHQMAIMTQESFAPVVGIMPVSDDLAAVALINDSAYGLTASLWSRDMAACIELGEQINVGTVFMNRCDYLDPALAWVGVKDSGRGCSLSHLAYQMLTRPKSFHLKVL
ncbi:MAG: aldehyde dehydrogenase family protein [Bermanella sp.]